MADRIFEEYLPPGTFRLIYDDCDLRDRHVVLLDPVPSTNPNEPLNWSFGRKATNFTLVMAVTCLVFTAISIQTIFWQLMVGDLNVTYSQINQAISVSYVGLSTGCLLFIPLAKKYGRRSVYLISTAIMLVTTFWMGKIQTLGELYIANLLQGLAGATNEAIVQITIADLFFVRYRGAMNGLYMTMVMIGTFLTPIAAGAQATRQGWRWSYMIMGIVNAVIFVLFVFLYEETKYTPTLDGLGLSQPTDDSSSTPSTLVNDFKTTNVKTNTPSSCEPSNLHHQLDTNIPIHPWQARLAWKTSSSESLWPYYYRPIIVLFAFPAVLFTALQYASAVVWMTVMSNVLSRIFPQPPYNFSPEQVGFMSVGPFIGNLVGAFYGGVLGDWSILYFSRKNKGYFEPEMRLYILHLPALAMTGGLIMFGVTIHKEMHWILPSVGAAMFGFGLGSISDICLTFVIDSYREITGDAFTGVAFLRNAISIGIPFAIGPWMQQSGVDKMFITCGFISLGITMLIIPMVYYGKYFRARNEPLLQRLVMQQGRFRGLE